MNLEHYFDITTKANFTFSHFDPNKKVFVNLEKHTASLQLRIFPGKGLYCRIQCD